MGLRRFFGKIHNLATRGIKISNDLKQKINQHASFINKFSNIGLKQLGYHQGKDFDIRDPLKTTPNILKDKVRGIIDRNVAPHIQRIK